MTQPIEKQPIGGLKKPKWDPRKFSFSKKFGSVVASQIPTANQDVWIPLITKDQGSNALCTDYGVTGAAEPFTKVINDEAFQRAAHNAIAGTPGYVGGGDPDQAALAAIKYGLLPKSDAPFTVAGDPNQFANLAAYPQPIVFEAGVHKEISKYDIDGQDDLFDSIRDAMLVTGPTNGFITVPMVGTNWRSSWLFAAGGIITTDDSDEESTQHEFCIVGQKTINNILYLKAHLSSGTEYGDAGFFYFSRSVVNAFLFAKAFAPGNPNDYKDQLWTTFQKIYDILFTIFSQSQTVGYPPPIAITQKPIPSPSSGSYATKIIAWANAIQIQEGGKATDRNMRNNNPGNIKATKYGLSLGTTSGIDSNQTAPGAGFCIYKTYQIGFDALCQLLTDACNNELIAYKSTMSIAVVTQIYAQPPNGNYALAVARAIGVDVSTPIGQLLL